MAKWESFILKAVFTAACQFKIQFMSPEISARRPVHDLPYLQVHVSQLILLDQVIDASDLQPGLRLLLPLAEIDRNPEALLGVIQRFAGGSAIHMERVKPGKEAHACR